MKRRTGSGTIATLILTVIFGATLLISLASGATVYRHVADRVEAGSRQRVGLSYITARIHGFDEAGMIYAGDFGGEDAVFLVEETDGRAFETIIYVHDGKLMELLCEDSAEFTPEDGDEITEATALTVSEPIPGLLRLSYTDDTGTTEIADVYLRSGVGRWKIA